MRTIPTHLLLSSVLIFSSTVSIAQTATNSCTASPIMFTLAHSALFIKQELLADRANRKPAGDGFVYEGNDCRGFPGRPDGYSDWTCPPKRTAAGSCGPFLFGCTWRANRKPAGEASVNEGNDCPRI